MEHPVMEHNDAAERQARKILFMMRGLTKRLQEDRMYDSFREIEEELKDIVTAINEYNGHVKAIKALLNDW